MNLYEIFESVNFRLAKDKQGNAFTPDNFNTALSAINDDKYSEELAKVMKVTANGIEIQPNGDQLEIGWFKKTETLTRATTNGVSLPVDYRQYISLKINGRRASIIPSDILDKFASSVLAFNPNERPQASFFPDYIQTIPTNRSSVVLTYYRLPLVPYMDYVVDENGKVYFMPVGSVLTAEGGSLQDSEGVEIANSVSHLLATTYPYTSVTQELDWRRTFHPSFIDFLVEWGAMNLRDQMAEQISLQK
jgi:hypothetical protein